MGWGPGEMQSAVLRLAVAGDRLEVAAAAVSLRAARRSVSRAACALVARGYLCRLRTGLYQITADGRAALTLGVTITSGPPGPRNRARLVCDTLRVRAWRAMRVRRRFTIGELVADAEGGERQPHGSISKYVAALKAAGYLRELPNRLPGTAPTSNGFKRFILVTDTGPRAPVYRPAPRLLHDPNTGEDVPCATTS